MISLFPKAEYLDAFSIPYEEYFGLGYRGIIFDIDNTLVLPDAPIDDRASTLIQRLKSIGFDICLVSNNVEGRVHDFAYPIDVKYVSKAAKPSQSGYKKAATLMGMGPRQILSIGDQIFTDVLGANLAGMYSILTHPFTYDEILGIRIKRLIEIPILKIYHLHK